jgi:hypothetical protein
MGDVTQARRLYLGDSRNEGRHMRVTWHPDTATIVFSHWVGDSCVASTHLTADDASSLVALLTDALRNAHLRWGTPRSDSA